MNKLHVMLGILIILFSVPSAMAITVDGVRGVNEWDERWAFGQEEASTYNPNGPFGNRMMIYQDGIWIETDPTEDSGDDFNDNMATEGPNPSGYDLENFYASYDPLTDTLYGMATVYGMPGDLDGDGAIDSLVSNGDTAGPDTGGVIRGIGIGEQFSITVVPCCNHTNGLQNKTALILVTANDVFVTDLDNQAIGVTANAANDPDAPNGVYEIQINGLVTYLGIGFGDNFTVRVIAGGNLDIPGEDIAEIRIEIPDPSIEIMKATNGDDADTPTGPELYHGDAVTWTYEVTNEGDVPLENVVVTDDQPGVVPVFQSGDTNGNDILDLTETWIYEAEDTVEMDFCGQYANIGYVVGYYGPIGVTDFNTSHYFVNCIPGIDIQKHTNGFDADFPQGPQIEVGETITWEYFVKNTGKVPLMNIVVVDDQIGTIPDSSVVSKSMNNDDILDVGETWTYVVTDTLEDCTPLYKNIATVTGEDESGTPVTDSDPSHYHCQPVVPVLSPVGILGLIGALGFLGIVTIRRRN